MKQVIGVRLLFCGVALVLLAISPTRANEEPAPAVEVPKPAMDVRKLFANSCSWCHGDFGMKEGKGGPKLAGTRLSAEKVKDRIANGKSGSMPGFKSTLKEDQIQALADYVKGLPAN